MTRRMASASLAAGLLATACGGGGTDATAGGDGPDVVAAFYPFAFVAQRVAGDDASAENLTQPGAEPHDLELTPRQVARLAEADVVIHLAGFQPAVDEAIEQNATGTVIEVGSIVPLGDTAGEVDGHAEEDAHAGESSTSEGQSGAGEDDHAGEDGHADADDHAGEDAHAGEEHLEADTQATDDDHAHDLEGDPHVWQDPTRLALVADPVAEALTEASPRAGDTFRANADQLKDDLSELDQEIRAGLADCERRVFVTSHSAFGYLASRYDLEMVGISGLSPESEPSPARVAEVSEVVEREGVTTIFYETLVNPAVAETMAADLGVRTAVLDPIEGLTEDTSGEDYFSLMRANLAALEEANGCS